MNRPIKFRAWHGGRNEWLHDGKPPLGGCHILGETIWAFGEWCRVPIRELNDVVVTQFTGLTLPNGTDIYEGDILNTKAARWEVVFERGAFVAKWLMGQGDKDTRNILWPMMEHAILIGNRFENPDKLTSP